MISFLKADPPAWLRDSDSARYIRAVEVADGSALDPGVRDAITNFIVGCKRDGIWNAIKASCILTGARTLAGALIPLKGAAPTNFNFVSGDYNRKTGLIGDGSTKYLDSNRNNNEDPQNSQHLAFSVSTASSVGGANALYGGSSSESPFTGVRIGRAATTGALFARHNSTAADIFSAPITGSETGLIGSARSNGANYTLRVGSGSTVVTRASVAPVDANLGVFCGIVGGTNTTTEYSNARLAFYSIGGSLDLALLDARVTTLINTFASTIP